MCESHKSPEKTKPKINMHFFFSPHMYQADAHGLVDKIAACDVFIPEQLGWGEKYAGALEMLVAGQITPDQFLNKQSPYYNFAQVKYGALYNSQKPFLLVDVTEKDPIIKEFDDVESEIEEIPFSRGYDGDFQALTASLSSALERLSILQSRRERYIVKNIISQLEKQLFEWYPELAKRDTINVLMAVGAEHTFLYHNYKKEGKEAAKSFSHMPVVVDYETQVLRRYAFGKKPDDDLIARTILEKVIYRFFSGVLDKQFSSSQELSNYVRKIVDMFDYKEIEDLYKTYYQWGNDPKILRAFLVQKIKEKGE